MKLNRRSFIEFLGKGVIGASVSSTMPVTGLERFAPIIIKPIKPSAADKLVLAKGLEYELLIRWQDPISAADTFGFNNDYVAFLPDAPDSGMLWVNHEYVHPMFVSGYDEEGEKSIEQIEKEQYDVGGSLFRIRREPNGM